MSEIFTVRMMKNQIRLNETGTEAYISPVVEIEMERAATVFIAQSIDGMELFAPVRYTLEKGPQSVLLKTMRVVQPRPGIYKIGISVSVSLNGTAPAEHSADCVLIGE